MWLCLLRCWSHAHKNSRILCLRFSFFSRSNATRKLDANVAHGSRQPKRKYRWETKRNFFCENCVCMCWCVYVALWEYIFFCLLLLPTTQIARCCVSNLMRYIIEILYVGFCDGSDNEDDVDTIQCQQNWHSVPANENKLSICILSNKMRLNFTGVKCFKVMTDEHQID